MLAEKIKNKVEEIVNKKITSIKNISGGSICNAVKLTFEENYCTFVKYGSHLPETMFEKETDGLKALRECNIFRVPNILYFEKEFILMEHIDQGMPELDFYPKFGRLLASLHSISNEMFGYAQDNFLGTSIQRNSFKESWNEFYFENRILFQLKIAEQKGHSTDELQKLIGKLELKLADILQGSEEKPALIHGDLWVGNYLTDTNSNPVLIDPAVCFGHRELELAMTYLFGGFSKSFYRSYNETYPLADGWEERQDIYKLYHLLNHYNLFGGSYYDQSIQILKHYLL